MFTCGRGEYMLRIPHLMYYASSSTEPVSRMGLSKPLFIPMGPAPKDVPDAVRPRVLYFAMSVPERATDPTCADLPRRRPLLLVSKTFHVRPIASSFSFTTAHVFLRYSASASRTCTRTSFLSGGARARTSARS